MILRTLICVTCFTAALLADNNLACLPSSPSSPPDTKVTLKAWYSTGGRIEYKWKVTAGAIRIENGETIWDLTGAAPGAQNADVDAIFNEAKVATCDIEFEVEGKNLPRGTGPGISRVSSRAFLNPGQNETDGYGLYSYFLFAAKPAAADKDRYAAIFAEVLRLLHPLEAFATLYKPSQLNATWLPVSRAATPDPDAKWLVENYNYDLAAALIAKAGISGNPQGIYIVSVPQPLTRFDPKPPFLRQDLSRVTAPLAATWVTMFLNQAAQQHYWNGDRMDELAANLRLAVAVAAQGVPDVKNAVATLIGVVK